MQLKKLTTLGDSYYLILCVMGAFAILSSTMSKNPVLNPFALSLGTPQDLTGLIAAASTIPGILISLPAASLSDVFGRRKLLLFSTFVFASAPFLYLFVGNWWQLAMVRFYHGFATAIFVPVAEATIAEQYPAKRGERISTFNAVTYIGRGAAPFLGGSILFVTSYGYHTLYLAVAAAGVTAFVIALLLRGETKNPPKAEANGKKVASTMLHSWAAIARNRGAVVVSFVQACQYYVYGVVEFYLVQYMMAAGLNALEISVVIGIQVISLIVARPLMGRFSDRIGRQMPIVAGCLVSAGLLFAVPFTTEFVVLLAISIGYGLGFAMVVSSTAPLMVETTPSNMVGASMGFLSTMMDVGQALGPIISGIILATALQYGGLFWSLTALLVLAAAIFVVSGVAKTKTVQ